MRADNVQVGDWVCLNPERRRQNSHAVLEVRRGLDWVTLVLDGLGEKTFPLDARVTVLKSSRS